jgi:hypothetical protein
LFNFNLFIKDIMSVLGAPNSVYYKSEELNKLGPNENSSLMANQNDYFYNYITLGLVNKTIFNNLK